MAGRKKSAPRTKKTTAKPDMSDRKTWKNGRIPSIVGSTQSLIVSGGKLRKREGILLRRPLSGISRMLPSSLWGKSHVVLERGNIRISHVNGDPVNGSSSTPFRFASFRSSSSGSSAVSSQPEEVHSISEVEEIKYLKTGDKCFKIRVHDINSLAPRKRLTNMFSQSSNKPVDQITLTLRAKGAKEAELWLKHLLLELRDHALLIMQMAKLLHEKKDRPEAADALFHRCISIWRTAFGDHTKQLSDACDVYAKFLRSQGRDDDAQTYDIEASLARTPVLQSALHGESFTTVTDGHANGGGNRTALDDIRDYVLLKIEAEESTTNYQELKRAHQRESTMLNMVVSNEERLKNEVRNNAQRARRAEEELEALRGKAQDLEQRIAKEREESRNGAQDFQPATRIGKSATEAELEVILEQQSYLEKTISAVSLDARSPMPEQAKDIDDEEDTDAVIINNDATGDLDRLDIISVVPEEGDVADEHRGTARRGQFTRTISESVPARARSQHIMRRVNTSNEPRTRSMVASPTGLRRPSHNGSSPRLALDVSSEDLLRARSVRHTHTRSRVLSVKDIQRLSLERNDEAATPPVTENPDVLGEGCYLVLSESNNGSLAIHWSKTEVEGALACFRPKGEVPKFKFTQNAGRTEIARGFLGGVGRKNYYKGWLQYISIAEKEAVDLVILDPHGCEFYYMDIDFQVHNILPRCRLDVDLIDAICVVPPKSGVFGGVKHMTKDHFTVTGNRVGAAKVKKNY